VYKSKTSTEIHDKGFSAFNVKKPRRLAEKYREAKKFLNERTNQPKTERDNLIISQSSTHEIEYRFEKLQKK
jgi:hypothetical protein